jgi:hypothetical protein
VRDVLRPRTDLGVAAQIVPAIVVVTVLAATVRRERALVTLTVGVGRVVLRLMGVRGLH